MKKFNLKLIGEFALDVCKVVGCGLAIVLPRVLVGYAVNKSNAVTADYSGAVEAIVKSDMLSSYQQEAIEALKTDGSIDYYKAVIQVAGSSSLSSYKVNMIRSLSNK